MALRWSAFVFLILEAINILLLRSKADKRAREVMLWEKPSLSNLSAS